MPKIGAHVSAAASLDQSLNRALEIKAECTQIFISPPAQWIHVEHLPQEFEDYKFKSTVLGIKPNFIHSTYLLNFGSKYEVTLHKSIEWLIYAQKTAEKLEVEGTVFHLGSFGERSTKEVIDQVAQALIQVIKNSDYGFLILENSAGAGDLIGKNFSTLGEIIKIVKNPKIKICLDTQHAFAAGYDLRSKKGLDEILSELDQEIGMERLIVIHANDSLSALGSNRDRHANIGEGLIGLEGFKNMLHHKALKDLPFILEVPGFPDGADKDNIQILKSLRE